MPKQNTLDEYLPDKQFREILDLATQMKEERVRPIPRADQYPAWWGRLRSAGQSPQSLGELDYPGPGSYHRDDREEPIYEQHFAEIHYHTDL